MVKWKIREFGSPNFLTLDVNPSSYNRSRQIEAAYEQLVDGSYCRSVAPCIYKKEEFQLIWSCVNQSQLDILSGFLNKKVEVVDHLLQSTLVYVDGIEKQYLITAMPEARYAVTVSVREV